MRLEETYQPMYIIDALFLIQRSFDLLLFWPFWRAGLRILILIYDQAFFQRASLSHMIITKGQKDIRKESE
ncbi:hypothetical protein AEA09_10435 [Lysinibacillus contaminans]|uniref:Uncharacterized protein n=1 Tax=Lysinibacillus contaminans TaxID=1293441 RepID=A0ABR5K2F0_9BACI|nr:hypothetical protein AEA09_10435 [Lysinibacillus contaminans]